MYMGSAGNPGQANPNDPVAIQQQAAQQQAFLQAIQAQGGNAAALGGPTTGATTARPATQKGVTAIDPTADLRRDVANKTVAKVPVVGGALTNALDPLGALNSATQNQFQAVGAELQPGTNADQLANAYNSAQNALSQQNALAYGLQPGVAQGLGTQNYLTSALTGVANGTGPNPAQAALNQATAANVSNQAALMAGQRGASQNSGLVARQAAMQGNAIQQQAAGQAATMQAQQQIAAQQQLAGLAGTQVGQGASAIQGMNNAAQNEQQILQGANAAYNNANVSNQANVNNVNSQVSMGNQKASNGLLGGAINGIGGALGLAHGGQVPMMADGGQMQLIVPTAPAPQMGGSWLNSAPISSSGPNIEPTPNMVGGDDPFASKGKKEGSGPRSKFGQAQSGMSSTGTDMGSSSGWGDMGSHISDPSASAMSGGFAMNHGGSVPAMVSPGELYLSPDKARKVAQSKDKAKEVKKEAKRVPGQAKVKGDSLKNDTVPAKLEEGGIVIPRSQAHDLHKAASFVMAHLAKNGVGLTGKKR